MVFGYLVALCCWFDRREKANKVVAGITKLTILGYIVLCLAALILSCDKQGRVCRAADISNGVENNWWSLEPFKDFVWTEWERTDEIEPVLGYSKTKATFLLYIGFFFAWVAFSFLLYIFSVSCKVVKDFEEMKSPKRLAASK